MKAQAPRAQVVVNDEAPAAWSLPTHAFRARQATLLLNHTQRAAVARRSRFYTFPWLHRADLNQPDFDDQLP